MLDPLGGSCLLFEKSSSLNSSSIILPSRQASFSPLHQMEKEKDEEDGGRVSLVWESGWHNMSVVVMILLLAQRPFTLVLMMTNL